MAARNFKKKQGLEHELKDLYCKFSPATLEAAAVAVLDLTVDIELESAEGGAARNGSTFELVVNAAAANPTDTVLVDFTGDEDAIVCTVTPNDGTNNAATPVPLAEDELAELINTGLVVGKTITLTDVDSLRELQTATGGDSSDLSAADDQEVEFQDGVDAADAAFLSNSGHGFASVERTDVGEYVLTLQDAYVALRAADAVVQWDTAIDAQFQLLAQAVDVDKSITLQVLAGASPVDLDPAAVVVFKAELKNSSVRD